MSLLLSDFQLLAPEIIILCTACSVLVVDLFLKDSQRDISYWLTQLGLLAAFIVTVFPDHVGQRLFNGIFIRDNLADLLIPIIYLIVAGGFIASRDYLKQHGLFKGEFYVLGLFGMLGMMIMISSHNFMTIYLGLELQSLSVYAMVALNRDSSSSAEAAMKYFVLGAIASGMLLYGMSIIYGLSGSLDILEIGNYVTTQTATSIPLLFGLSFIIVGLAFKLGAVPFHMWLPDVYQGASTPVTLYIGTAPKIAGFAITMRLLVEALGGIQADWQQMLIVLAVLSLAVGNIVAIAQTNIKRMLAYSTISHIGFILLGILSGTVSGYASAMFYTIIYAVMSLGGFGMIILLSREGFEAEELNDFSGLSERSPWFAFIMLVLMFSMAGVPLTVGFYAKLLVLQSVIGINQTWLAAYAVIFSIVGAFYYLRVIKLMYFDKPQDVMPIVSRWDLKIMLSISGLLMLLLFLYPESLMSLCINAFAS